MGIVEKLLASLMERVLGNKVTSAIGLLVMLAGAMGGAGKAVAPDVVLFGFNAQAALMTLAAIVGGVALLLAKDAGVKPPKLPVLLLVLLVAGTAQAQNLLEPQPTGLENYYAAGLSYSVNAAPAVSGTGLYARRIASSNTYGFTVVDALPNTVKPFTITTNMGVGVAQKVKSFGKIDVFMPAAAGISWTGANTGWQWNGGLLVVIPLGKQGYSIAPTVRFLKSSVSNGSTYQPIVGLLFGWGK